MKHILTIIFLLTSFFAVSQETINHVKKDNSTKVTYQVISEVLETSSIDIKSQINVLDNDITKLQAEKEQLRKELAIVLSLEPANIQAVNYAITRINIAGIKQDIIKDIEEVFKLSYKESKQVYKDAIEIINE